MATSIESLYAPQLYADVYRFHFETAPTLDPDSADATAVASMNGARDELWIFVEVGVDDATTRLEPLQEHGYEIVEQRRGYTALEHADDELSVVVGQDTVLQIDTAMAPYARVYNALQQSQPLPDWFDPVDEASYLETETQWGARGRLQSATLNAVEAGESTVRFRSIFTGTNVANNWQRAQYQRAVFHRHTTEELSALPVEYPDSSTVMVTAETAPEPLTARGHDPYAFPTDALDARLGAGLDQELRKLLDDQSFIQDGTRVSMSHMTRLDSPADSLIKRVMGRRADHGQ